MCAHEYTQIYSDKLGWGEEVGEVAKNTVIRKNNIKYNIFGKNLN